MVLPAIACLAINSGCTTNGALGQFVLEMAEPASTTQQEPTTKDQPSARPTTPLLRGGAIEQSSPLLIIQRSQKSIQFEAELRKRSSMIDSSVYREMQGQIDRSAPLQAELNATNWLLPRNPRDSRYLQGELDSDDRYNIPRLNFLQPQLDPNLQRQPVLGLRSPSLSPHKSNQVSGEIESELARNKPVGIRYGEPTFRTSPTIERQFDIPVANYGPSAASTSIEANLRNQATRSSAEISGQLKGATRPTAVPDIEGELRAQQAIAKPMLDKQRAIASTQITAVFRRMPQPQADLETDARLLLNRDSESAINWDAWYARVAKLSEPLLVSAVEGSRGPEGANTVSITVKANHHLSVSLIDGGNAAFNAAIMRAYRGLDGNPGLAFPAGSHRAEVTFFADNDHIAPGNVSGVSTQSCIGDTELSRKR